ncbi:MAG: hypothetical protein KAG53_06365 [Endozoicomonadaceae bacterium]|nr:hypothetical protein [Endozoicomonadaceae bacterium]
MKEKDTIIKRSLKYFPFSLYCIINQLTDSCKTFNVTEELTINNENLILSVQFTDSDTCLATIFHQHGIKFYRSTSDTTWKKEPDIDSDASSKITNILHFDRNKMMALFPESGLIELRYRNPDDTWTTSTTFPKTPYFGVTPAFSLDGNHVSCSMINDEILHIYSKKQLNGCEKWVNQLRPVNTQNTQNTTYYSTLFSADSRFLIMASHSLKYSDRTVEIYSLDPVTTMWGKDITISSIHPGLAKFSNDGNQVIIADIDVTLIIYKRGEDNVWTKHDSFDLEYNLQPKNDSFNFENKRIIRDIKFNRIDGRQIVIVSQTGIGCLDSLPKFFLHIFKMKPNGLWMNELNIRTYSSHAISDDGNHAAIVDTIDEKTLHLYGRNSKNILESKVQILVNDKIKTVNFSPNSSNMLFILNNDTVKIYGMDKKYEWINKSSFNTSGFKLGSVPLASFSLDSSKIIISNEYFSRIWRLSSSNHFYAHP